MVSRMILNRSQRWRIFVCLAILVNGVLVAAAGAPSDPSNREIDLGPQPCSSPPSEQRSGYPPGDQVVVFALTQESSLARR